MLSFVILFYLFHAKDETEHGIRSFAFSQLLKWSVTHMIYYQKDVLFPVSVQLLKCLAKLLIYKLNTFVRGRKRARILGQKVTSLDFLSTLKFITNSYARGRFPT